MHSAIDAAIKDINADGGVDGAKITEDFCSTDGTPDSAINCANKLVGDHVALVTYGLEIAAAAQTPIFAGAGIPLIVNVDYDPKISSDIWQTGPAISAYSLYQMLALKQLGAKHPGYIGTADSTHETQAKQMQDWGKMAAFDPVVAPFQNPTNADWSTAVQTAETDGADGFNFGLVENECTAIVSAASQIGFKGPIVTTCSQFLYTLPHSATANTYLSGQGYLPAGAASAPPQIQRNMADYVKAMTAAGLASQVNTEIEDQYATTEDIATLLRTVSAPKITASTVKTALGVNQNLPGFDGPDINCGGHAWAGNPQACFDSILVSKNTFQNGQLVLVPILKSNYGFWSDSQYAAQSANIP
jgi:branched-chain amino acid transport system substrate-binding protein